jgi:hypothetical protein
VSVSPSRRRLLQAAALAPVVASCTSHAGIHDGHTDPDAQIRELAVARERALIEQYRAAAASSAAQVATRTAGLAEQHEQHLAALGAVPHATATASPAPLRVPTLAELAAAEHAAAAAHAGDALRASSSLAALLASLAASEASHAVVLT